MAKKEFNLDEMLADTATPVPSVPVVRTGVEKRTRKLTGLQENIVSDLKEMSELSPAQSLGEAVAEIQFYANLDKLSILEIGRRLVHIRDYKLFEETHSDFVEWTKEAQLGVGWRMAYYYIELSENYGEFLEGEEVETSKLIATLPLLKKNPELKEELFDLARTHTVSEIRQIVKDKNRKEEKEILTSEKEQALEKLKKAFKRTMQIDSGNTKLAEAYALLFS